MEALVKQIVCETDYSKGLIMHTKSCLKLMQEYVAEHSHEL